MTHKRIIAKTSGGLSIDADIKPARFIGYLQHTMQNISFSASSDLTQRNSFSMLVGIFEFTFFIFFTFLLLGCSFMLESGFLLLPIFHWSSRLANTLYMYTDSGNVACDLILFRAFLGGFIQCLLYSRMAWRISRCLNYAVSLTAEALKGFHNLS